MMFRHRNLVLSLLWMVPAAAFSGQERLTPAPPLANKMRATREVAGNAKAAAAEFRKSQEALEEGKIDQAIRHLRNGISLDPSNASAYNDLGVIYFNMQQPDKALEAFTAMTEADPGNHRGFVNLAFVLNGQQRYEEAERAARRAVDLRKMDLKARYLLGMALASQKKNLDEAMNHLTAAAGEFPEAQLEMSRILIEKGDFEQAMRLLQNFNKTGKRNAGGGAQLLAK